MGRFRDWWEHFTGKDQRRTVSQNSGNNALGLIPGQKYILIKSFTDYDREVHPIGETWTFISTKFLPYEDGLTLHVEFNDRPARYYRLQWRREEQADIIESFSEYVKPC